LFGKGCVKISRAYRVNGKGRVEGVSLRERKRPLGYTMTTTIRTRRDGGRRRTPGVPKN